MHIYKYYTEFYLIFIEVGYNKNNFNIYLPVFVDEANNFY